MCIFTEQNNSIELCTSGSADVLLSWVQLENSTQTETHVLLGQYWGET